MLEFWFMFPVAVLFASIAMAAGIGGAILFSPFLIVVLGFSPVEAIAAGLVIEMFGFTSGVVGYWRKRQIDFSVVKALVKFTLPATIVGVIISYFVSPIILQIVLILLLLFLVWKFLGKKEYDTSGVRGEKINLECTSAAGFGAGLMGMVSSGLGEIDEYIFLDKLKLPPRIASGTSVVLVAMSAAIGVITHAAYLILNNELATIAQVAGVVIFAVPGVIIGAQLGVYSVQNISASKMRLFLGLLFSFLAIVLLLRVLGIL